MQADIRWVSGLSIVPAYQNVLFFLFRKQVDLINFYLRIVRDLNQKTFEVSCHMLNGLFLKKVAVEFDRTF